MTDRQTAPQYTGHMTRNPDGTITGTIADAWGWTITLSMTKDPAGGYTLTGELGDVPEALRIPAVDGAA